MDEVNVMIRKGCFPPLKGVTEQLQGGMGMRKVRMGARSSKYRYGWMYPFIFLVSAAVLCSEGFPSSVTLH